jgi:hypothetical protein
MTREELKPALEWADSLSSVKVLGTFIFPPDAKKHAPSLASALREAWAEIDHLNRLRTDLEYAVAHRYDAWKNPLDAALNEGDGSYKP